MQTSDVIIIGGGIHGASLAFHLAQMGVKPTVLEKQFIAAGATGRSSGLVRMHYDLEPESRLAWISLARKTVNKLALSPQHLGKSILPPVDRVRILSSSACSFGRC